MADIRNTHTSQHPATPGIEWRVSKHQPMKSVPEVEIEGEGTRNGALVPNGDPYPVIELFVRQTDGSWGMVASFREDAYRDQVDDIERLIGLFGFPVNDEDAVAVRQGGTEFKIPKGRKVLTGSDE